jgi:hypothetical protein
MVVNTGLEILCHTADSASEMKKEVLKLMKDPFGEEEKLKREKVLEEKFSNRKNVKRLLKSFL